jgi:hypothetical protein
MTALLVITSALALRNNCPLQSMLACMHAGQSLMLTFASPEDCARQAAEAES